MSRLIGVTGYKNSGKNAVCNVLRDEFGFVITGFADVLKSMALAIDPIVYVGTEDCNILPLSSVVHEYGWDIAKEEFTEVRRFLQVLGTEGVRTHLGQDAWIKAWAENTRSLFATGKDVCVSDPRFLNEAAAIKSLGGEVWRVYRPGTAATNHASETELDNIVVQRRIHNDGDLEALSVVVRKMMA